MAFRMYCTSCKTDMEPLVDKGTKKVHCSECDSELKIDPYMANTLITLGQIRRASQKKSSFGIVCTYCEKKETPKLGKNKEILCGHCSKDITDKISDAFVQMLRQNLTKNDNS